ncbi:MAG TPA: sigma-70 family RNA polymerase sigma factor [Acidimicrobiales bacterium]
MIRVRRQDGGARPSGIPTWEEIARERGDFIYTVAYRLTGNRHDAQDLVQEVLLRVQRGLSTYRPGSMDAWLGRITTNAFLDDVRRRRRRPVVALPDVPELVAPGAPAADEALAQEALPSDMSEALLALPDDYRAAVVLCDVVGLRYDEIAEELGVPVGTVRSRIHRGRALLRRTLA